MNVPNRRWLRIFILIIGLACLVLPSCLSPNPQNNPPAEPVFKAALLQDRIFPDTVIALENPLLVDPADRMIHLFAAGDEKICFQIIIPPGNPGPLTLEIEPLKLTPPGSASTINAIDPGRWRLFQVLSAPVNHYDAVSARLERPEDLKPRRMPDPFIEIQSDKPGQFPVLKNADENTLLLLELSVPAKIKSGEFSGQVRLKSPAKSSSRSIVLRTWGFDLPEPKIDIFGIVNGAKIWTEHEIGSLRDRDRLIFPPDESRVKTFAEILGRYCKVLDENGVEPWVANVYPRITGSETGNMEVEWGRYRAMVDAVLKNSSRHRKFWPVPVDLSYPSSQLFGPYSSVQYQKALKQYLIQCNEKILKNGLAGLPLAALGWPEDYRQAQEVYDSYLSLAREIYRTEIPITIVNPFIPADLRPLGWREFKPFNKIKQVTQAVCPVEKWLDPSMIAKLQSQGTRVWFRPNSSGDGIPALNVTYPPYLAQALPWAARRYDTQGVVLENINPWQTGENDLENSKNRLIYPGKWFGRELPAGSIRLKMIKAGLQDISYLRALERAGKKDLADWLVRHLVRFAHTDACDGSLWVTRNDGLCDSDQAWAIARLIAGFELMNKSQIPTTEPFEANQLLIRQKILLARFRELTEGVSFEIDGVRAKNVLDITTGNEKVEWTFHSVVRNFSDTEGGAALQFLKMYPPLTAARDKVKISSLPWAWPVREELKLESSAVALGVYGVNLQPLSLKLKDNTEIFLNARYCALAAGKLDKAIQVDGSFDDWPDNPAAVAGNFQRIWPDGINDRRLAAISRNALWNTTVGIGYTSQHLYFAFTCRQPKDTLVTRQSNTLTSSAGLPWDEDLIEIMINPGNTDSFNPLDVFHLIVKANGNCLGLRGTVDAAGEGAAPVWPNTVQSAVKIYDDRWQAEVAIPLADLGGPEKMNRWWGIDFARFAAAISEMSSWSGAKNQYCKPLSLGNVFFAR